MLIPRELTKPKSKGNSNQTVLEQYYPPQQTAHIFQHIYCEFNKAQFSFFQIPYICYYSNLLYHPFISFFLNHIYGHNLRMPAFYKFSFKLVECMVRNGVRGGKQRERTCFFVYSFNSKFLE